MAAEIVIAVYHPRQGRNEELMALLRAHTQLLRSRGLITSREAVMMQAKDGSFLEIFEWASTAAVDEAHAAKDVGNIWKRLGEAAEFGQLSSLEEAHRSFPHFRPV